MKKAVIYETRNLYNEMNGIYPFLYIGSQQNYTEQYLGSSKQLLVDIKNIGKEFFEKKIICEFSNDIDNKFLRKLESDIQKYLDVANDVRYYNRTNSSHKGYVETMNERVIRMNKTKNGRKEWLNSLTKEEKNNYYKKTSGGITSFAKKIKGKSYDEIFGVEKANKKRKSISGKNNGLSKQVILVSTNQIFDSIKEIKEFLGIKKNETIVKMCKIGDKIKFLRDEIRP